MVTTNYELVDGRVTSVGKEKIIVLILRGHKAGNFVGLKPQENQEYRSSQFVKIQVHPSGAAQWAEE